MVIPKDKSRKGLKNKTLQKKYYEVVDFVDSNNLRGLCWAWATKVLRDGVYYGVVGKKSKNKITVIDLPIAYCNSDYKDLDGKDLIRFDLSYFDNYTKEDRVEMFKCYPKYFKKYYDLYKKGKTTSYIFIPSEQAIYYNLFSIAPYFLNVIPSIIQYNESIDLEKEKELDEIRKILVQKVPHLNDGTLVFEPDEALEMHQGAVNMLKANKNLSVLTTYSDVDVVSSKTAHENQTSLVQKMTENLYAGSGVSGQLFSLAGGQAIKTSINKDTALMMVLANSFETFFTQVINSIFGNDKISFSYRILPITHQNEKEYIENTYKLASLGYSFIMPALALGISESELNSIKDLENNVLKLGEKLIPLQSAFQSGGDQDPDKKDAGGQQIEPGDKADQTIKNDDSKDNQGGSN